MQALLDAPIIGQKITLDTISALDAILACHFASRFMVDSALTRSLVSFQDSKNRPRYRWYKFKEAFSPALVEYLLSVVAQPAGKLLDPFAGSGTALFGGKSLGWHTTGIELLPIGQRLIKSRHALEVGYTTAEIEHIQAWAEGNLWQNFPSPLPLPELKITKGAYPTESHKAIEQYVAATKEESERIQSVLWLALLSVLESVSYTRKDGQYLRWDYRSGRKQGKKRFDKGYIPPFEYAIRAKLIEILEDIQPAITQLSLFPSNLIAEGTLSLRDGSCLEVLPTLPENEFDLIITSPPYCNRYDYTRTYALELALLGIDESGLSALRQTMLSCTVENRVKDLLALNSVWIEAIRAANQQPLLQAILHYLDEQKRLGLLNNAGIPRMVRGYFYEMACVIQECGRVLKSGGHLLMVNDNVRYAGASISVDMILSSIAETLGFEVKQILVLPNGKGNSSQQMGEHGREELRKCVYLWQKR